MIVFDPDIVKTTIEWIIQQFDEGNKSNSKNFDMIAKHLMTVNRKVYILLAHFPIAVELHCYNLRPDETFNITKINPFSDTCVAGFRIDKMSLDTVSIAVKEIIERTDS